MCRIVSVWHLKFLPPSVQSECRHYHASWWLIMRKNPRWSREQRHRKKVWGGVMKAESGFNKLKKDLRSTTWAETERNFTNPLSLHSCYSFLEKTNQCQIPSQHHILFIPPSSSQSGGVSLLADSRYYHLSKGCFDAFFLVSFHLCFDPCRRCNQWMYSWWRQTSVRRSP